MLWTETAGAIFWFKHSTSAGYNLYAPPHASQTVKIVQWYPLCSIVSLRWHWSGLHLLYLVGQSIGFFFAVFRRLEFASYYIPWLSLCFCDFRLGASWIELDIYFYINLSPLCFDFCPFQRCSKSGSFQSHIIWNKMVVDISTLFTSYGSSLGVSYPFCVDTCILLICSVDSFFFGLRGDVPLCFIFSLRARTLIIICAFLLNTCQKTKIDILQGQAPEL